MSLPKIRTLQDDIMMHGGNIKATQSHRQILKIRITFTGKKINPDPLGLHSSSCTAHTYTCKFGPAINDPLYSWATDK